MIILPKEVHKSIEELVGALPYVHSVTSTDRAFRFIPASAEGREVTMTFSKSDDGWKSIVSSTSVGLAPTGSSKLVCVDVQESVISQLSKKETEEYIRECVRVCDEEVESDTSLVCTSILLEIRKYHSLRARKTKVLME